MPQLDRNSQRENKQRGSEPNFNWRGVVLIVIAFSLIAMAMLFYRGGMQPVEDVPYNRFLELLEKTVIQKLSSPVGRRGWPPNADAARRVHPAGCRRSALTTDAVPHNRLFEFHQ
jgi:hypothetical protein